VDIAVCYWGADPHLAAALMWEAYAAMLDAEPSVSSVSTGVQSVTYQPAWPGGAFGRAMAKAKWHRDMAGNLGSVPVGLADPYIGPERTYRGGYGWWEVYPVGRAAARHR